MVVDSLVNEYPLVCLRVSNHFIISTSSTSKLEVIVFFATPAMNAYEPVFAVLLGMVDGPTFRSKSSKWQIRLPCPNHVGDWKLQVD